MGGDNYFGILRPHTELVSTNAVDNTDEFVAGTLYDLGAEVKVSAENNLYKCLTKDTTEVPTGNKTTENWLFLGKTNPHKMFDEKYKSRTIKESGNLVVTKGRTVKDFFLLVQALIFLLQLYNFRLTFYFLLFF